MDSLRVVLWILLWSSLAEGDEDFQEFLFCTNSSSEVLRCPEGEVIDIQQVRVANLWAMGITNPCSDLSSKSAVTDRYYQQCKQDLTFFSCHGEQSCIVNRTMAAVWLPDCLVRWDDPPGLFSDVLYVNYTCYKLKDTTPFRLPFTDDVTQNVSSHQFDIINPGFPDVTEEGQFNVTCLIRRWHNTQQKIKLKVITEVLYVEGQQGTPNSGCVESLHLTLSRTSLVCSRDVPQEVRNDQIDAGSGDNWTLGYRNGDNLTLDYRSDGTVGHKFWLIISATTEESGDPANMTISCVDNQEETTTATTKATTTETSRSTTPFDEPNADEKNEKQNDKENNNLVIGVSAGAALLVVVAVVIAVVFVCRKRRYIKRQPDRTPEPSAPQGDDVTGLYCIANICTSNSANFYDIKAGAPNGAKPKKPPRIPIQAPKTAKNEEMNTVQYADVVVVPLGAVYAQVSTKGRKNKVVGNVRPWGKKMDGKEESRNPNMLDGEMIMEENTELYAKEVMPLNKMAKKDEKNTVHLEEETIMVGNSDLYSKENLGMSDNPFSKDSGDLYDSVSPRQLSSDVMDGYHNVGFSEDEGHSG